MVSKAVHKYARVSPKKARIVLDLIRGKGVEEASSILLSRPQESLAADLESA